MWLILQQAEPEDFVIATGEQYSVRDFVNAAAEELGMRIRWEGQGAAEKGYDERGRCIVAVDPRYFRPTEVETLLGDPAKARTRLGWTPEDGLQAAGRGDGAGGPEGRGARRAGQEARVLGVRLSRIGRWTDRLSLRVDSQVAFRPAIHTSPIADALKPAPESRPQAKPVYAPELSSQSCSRPCGW